MKIGQAFRKPAARLALMLTLVVLTGCAHQVGFDPEADYSLETARQDVPLMVVIDEETRKREEEVRSATVGWGHTWHVQVGEMLYQVADIEFSQTFNDHEMLSRREESEPGSEAVALELEVPEYRFEGFEARLRVKARAFSANGETILDESYYAVGQSQGAKMFWGGAFAMKSALRQSSMDAYRQAFRRLRDNLEEAI